MAAASRALGRAVGQARFAHAAGTTLEDGTDESDLKRGLLAADFVPDEFASREPAAALLWARVQLLAGRPVIACVAHHSHWVTLVGVLGKAYVVFDPGRFEYRVNSGVSVVTADRLRRWWRAGGAIARRHRTVYYGLSVCDGRR